MLDKIIHFSIYNKGVIGFFTVLLVIVGIYSATQLPIDAVPDITNNQVQIITQAPTLGAQEVEQFITTPIELAMSNIADVIEKRSISRSGISVITIVFKDETDIYWARQQVGERLKEAEVQIPKGMGEPLLAPITTGLGEIYHYVIHTKPGYEEKYSATDLRTIQDWIVRRQLAGTTGLAEVSGWGGFIKQYEIALDNDKINALNITIPEIYKALEENNENTGGSYIEQQSNAYFIRGLGLVKSLADIEKIVVKTVNDIPVLIRDVAVVQFGSATRFGAITRNGEGEAVAGITLMLKGENFSKVIKNVKERIEQIQASLPEGVIIEPFIDRIELVGRAIGTVQKNLIEGALIVIFILVLLLGNMRAGLLVASVIPLAMLFAITMMHIFGVSGNLMSLGAIDFGLIVDGAVIIVEAIVHRITMNKLNIGSGQLSKEQMNTEVYTAASKIRSSAAFGEIIILIVYLPIFSLVGIEGKMFRPMAQTVAFAILGAFILSLTYVPMMSAWFLSKKTEHKRNISDRIMEFFQRIYSPVLNGALKWKKTVIAISIALFTFTLWQFSNLGGEFIPTLEEGDLTVEISMMQGTSLTQVVETFGKAEKILKEKFPEIKQIVTRIGSAEIPTDPMPIERGDMMISMKPKEEWTSAESREEMMEKMEEALSILPGINKELTQPMQMRFNELMTGIRQDVAIKIYGEDLDTLTQTANKVAQWIAPVNGVSEAIVEKVTGLPQIVVEYNRDKIAQYGLSISDINMILKTAFAGNVAGVVFEGEKRFDMVVRLQSSLRTDITDIENLFIPLASGKKIPLNQVANIQFKNAPAQISHEDGKRRIYVGFNVRGRDVESVVKDIEKILSDKLKLPPGYYTTYGGQFQNLREANQRLQIAVPIALALIFLLLYITFRSVKQTFLIFTAVPLSIIGGVFALWLRDMPFSISAGVGFIALFGVAVLNGIVLISYFNQLEEEGITDLYERVREGTKLRLRPVIMTAAVASLGFLPMALSNSAGAEVQKPLATVVIGGLLSATLLTLVVLPILYILFSGKKRINSSHKGSILNIMAIFFIPLALLSNISNINAQTNQVLTLDNCIDHALKNNPELKASTLEVKQQQVLKKSSIDLPKTNLSLMQGQYNSIINDTYLSVTQEISFPTVYTSQYKVQKQEVLLSEKSLAIIQTELIKNVKLSFYQLTYELEKLKLLSSQDSIYKNILSVADLRYKTGETSYLEKLSIQSRYQEIQVLKKKTEADVTVYYQELRKLLNIKQDFTIEGNKLDALQLTLNKDSSIIKQSPLLDYYNQKISLANSQLSLEKNKLFPDFSVGYFNQSLDAVKGFQGYQMDINIPIFFWSQQGKIQSRKIQTQIAQAEYENEQNNLNSAYNQLFQQYQKNMEVVNYYQSNEGGLKQAEEIIKVSQFSYSKGEIGYVEHIQNMTQALNIKLQYLDNLNALNQTVIHINYITGTK